MFQAISIDYPVIIDLVAPGGGDVEMGSAAHFDMHTGQRASGAEAAAVVGTPASVAISGFYDQHGDPIFDPHTGFPRNAAAEAKVREFWGGMVTSPDEKSFAFRLPYKLLEEATDGFSVSMRIGGGASCAVYKAAVFGVVVAVKALTPMAGESERQQKSEEKQFAAEMALLMVRLALA